MPIISTPPSVVLTPEQLAAQEVAKRSTQIRNSLINQLKMKAMTRRECSDAYYGGGVAVANALFSAHSDGGVGICKRDISERAQNAADLAEINPTDKEIDAESLKWLTCSPVPANMDLIPLDAQGNPTADLSTAVVISVVAK